MASPDFPLNNLAILSLPKKRFEKKKQQEFLLQAWCLGVESELRHTDAVAVASTLGLGVRPPRVRGLRDDFLSLGLPLVLAF